MAKMIINLSKTGGKVPEGVVRIDRNSPWGNPYSDNPRSTARWLVEDRRRAVDEFAYWAEFSDDNQAVWIRDHIHQLKGRDLACWCAPRKCHGEILEKMANADEDDQGWGNSLTRLIDRGTLRVDFQVSHDRELPEITRNDIAKLLKIPVGDVWLPSVMRGSRMRVSLDPDTSHLWRNTPDGTNTR